MPRLSVVRDLPTGKPRMPWDRKDDTDKSWAAFCIYREMRPRDRSYAAVARELSIKDVKWITKWAIRYDWKSRAAAYDHHLDQGVQDKLINERWQNAERRAQIGDALLTRAVQVLQRFDPATATITDAVAMIRLADSMQTNVYFPRADTGVNVNAVAQIVIDPSLIPPATVVREDPPIIIDADQERA